MGSIVDPKDPPATVAMRKLVSIVGNRDGDIVRIVGRDDTVGSVDGRLDGKLDVGRGVG